jgi:dipeptidyl aminopeptidase/acylaminoacyl peptidase
MANLIPKEVLFGNPEKLSPQLSPDGKYLAYIAPDERKVLQVWVRGAGKIDDRVLTQDQKRGIRSFFWTFQPDQLIYLQDADGDENFHLYAVDVTAKNVRDITPFKGVRAQVVALEPTLPDEILVGLNKNDPRKHDVYRVRLSTAEAALDTENPGNVLGWTTDAKLQVRAALAATPDGGHEIWLRESPQASWKTILVLGPDDQGGPVDFSVDGRTLYLISSAGANAQRLLAWDTATGKQTVIAEDASYDVNGVFFHPTRRIIQAVSFYKDKLTWRVVDPGLAGDFETLAKLHPGEVHISHGDLADTTWLVSYVNDTGPVLYYLYDRKTKKAGFLFSQRPSLEGLPLVPIQPVSFKSRDGLTLHAYLTRPSPSENLPIVLLVHGGPWARDRWGFNPMAQWLANRGYAVLQVNYRGSTGFGKDFLNAGNREWAGKMHDDLIDGVRWLIGKKIADPKRVAIMGASYGGYATLVGLTFTPDIFCCGIDIVGPSNIITLIKTIPPYWEPMRAAFARRLGVLEKDEEFMKSRSPLFFVDRIQVPLLIGQGANDPRVKQAESDQIVEAMRKNGKPVEYLVYADEGHGFARPQNRMHFYGKVEVFLAKYLGGRAEAEMELAGHSAASR